MSTASSKTIEQRLAVMDLLRGGPATASEIASTLGLGSTRDLSNTVMALRRRGFIESVPDKSARRRFTYRAVRQPQSPDDLDRPPGPMGRRRKGKGKAKQRRGGSAPLAWGRDGEAERADVLSFLSSVKGCPRSVIEYIEAGKHEGAAG